MHVHEYECKKCLHKFVIAHPSGEHDKHRVVKCPACHSTHVRFCTAPLGVTDHQIPTAGATEKQ